MTQPNHEHIRWDEPFLDVTAVLRRWGFSHGTDRDFRSNWKARHPWGIPDPLYVGDDDVCGMGPELAPNNVCLFAVTGEFLRAPSLYALSEVKAQRGHGAPRASELGTVIRCIQGSLLAS